MTMAQHSAIEIDSRISAKECSIIGITTGVAAQFFSLIFVKYGCLDPEFSLKVSTVGAISGFYGGYFMNKLKLMRKLCLFKNYIKYEKNSTDNNGS